MVFMKEMCEPKPFFKWAGGKRQLLNQLLQYSPSDFNNYYEPFLGGGALFFKLSQYNKIKKCYLNDSNPLIITAYKTVKQKPKELIKELNSEAYKNTKENFLKIREETPSEPIKATARFLFLNRTAFNGLYRVNSKGEFNVPFGKYKNPNICDEKNIMAVSRALQKDELTNKDFADAISSAKKGDFVYFDPPYAPLSKTSSFTSYTKKAFGENEQKRLAETFKRLDKKGCFVMLSNSYASLILDLYKEFNINTVQATRMINCKATGRGKIKEAIITNYKNKAQTSINRFE
jgi:DNA adenine methylase